MLVLGVLSLFFIAIHAQCPPWSYDETAPNGPAYWGELCREYENCLYSQEQSPIDLTHTLEVFGEKNHLQRKYGVINNFTFGILDFAFEV
jgi:carbonic anhydrase